MRIRRQQRTGTVFGGPLSYFPLGQATESKEKPKEEEKEEEDVILESIVLEEEEEEEDQMTDDEIVEVFPPDAVRKSLSKDMEKAADVTGDKPTDAGVKPKDEKDVKVKVEPSEKPKVEPSEVKPETAVEKQKPEKATEKQVKEEPCEEPCEEPSDATTVETKNANKSAKKEEKTDLEKEKITQQKPESVMDEIEDLALKLKAALQNIGDDSKKELLKRIWDKAEQPVCEKPAPASGQLEELDDPNNANTGGTYQETPGGINMHK